MRISDWSSDVCSSDLRVRSSYWRGSCSHRSCSVDMPRAASFSATRGPTPGSPVSGAWAGSEGVAVAAGTGIAQGCRDRVQNENPAIARRGVRFARSEEHTSELQSLMRISYAVFCLQKKKQKTK